MRRVQLRKAVTERYLAPAEATERQWWEAHPEELEALFKKHLLKAKRNGVLGIEGKLVSRCA